MRGFCQAPFQQLLRRQLGHIGAAFMKHPAELGGTEELQHLQSTGKVKKAKVRNACHSPVFWHSLQSHRSSIPGYYRLAVHCLEATAVRFTECKTTADMTSTDLLPTGLCIHHT